MTPVPYQPSERQRPWPIARRCIRIFTCIGDTVLDPFAGSGTTLKVAKELKRKYIGYEIYTATTSKSSAES